MHVISLGKSNKIFIQIVVFTLILTILFCTLNSPGLSAGAQEFGYKSNVASLGNPNATSILTQLFSKVENSAVQVTASVNATNLYGSSLGSGFIYDRNGHIVTNYHVVGAASNIDDILVTFQDGSVFNANLVASDPLVISRYYILKVYPEQSFLQCYLETHHS